eukprot:g18530.t1
MDVAALQHQFEISLRNHNTPCHLIDTQLVLEYFTGEVFGGFSALLRKFGVAEHPNKLTVTKQLRNGNETLFAQRPLTAAVLEYAAADVVGLLRVGENMSFLSGDEKLSGRLTNATILRYERVQRNPMEACRREMRFHPVASRAMSAELFRGLEFEEATLEETQSQPRTCDDLEFLLEKIPIRYSKALYNVSDLPAGTTKPEVVTDGLKLNSTAIQLRDIILEVGARPYAYLLDGSREQSKSRFVQNSLTLLNATSAPAEKTDARPPPAASDFEIGGSILLLGRPGSGKTTIIRDIARLLSVQGNLNVIVVDTSNEICGDGIVPHTSVGMARRMMVPALEKQAGVLIEAVQNHTPDVIICDEIGRLSEVEAVQTVKERGVRCVASAHGCLKSLVQNSLLNGLVGGVETATVGDAQARKLEKSRGGVFSKVVQNRMGAVVFEVVVELCPENLDEWVVIKDVGMAVDAILAGREYKREVRRRCRKTGAVSVELGYGR